MAQPRTQSAPATAVAADPAPYHVDWPAILAGAFLAAAVAFVLNAFGAAVGLSLVSPYEGEGMSATVGLIAVAIWVMWVSASSFMVGGYVTGRLRRRVRDATEHESDVRDIAHGLVVWAVGIVIGGLLLASGAATTARIGTEGAAAAADTLGGAAQAAGDEVSLDYWVDRMLRGGGDAAAGEGAAREVRGILGTVLGEGGGLEAVDRDYLVTLIASRTGLGPEEARARVDEVVSGVQAAATEARDAAEAARKFGVVSGFVITASLLIAAAAAAWGAGIGGRHRDRQTVFPWLSFR